MSQCIGSCTMLDSLVGLFKYQVLHEGLQPHMRFIVGDTEYQIAWSKKIEEVLTVKKDKDGKVIQGKPGTEELREKVNGLLGSLIKYSLKAASKHYHLMNPVLKDIDGNRIFVNSITAHKITPVFASSTDADGVKTTGGVDNT